jgi:sugar lactone lactonase YvrE
MAIEDQQGTVYVLDENGSVVKIDSAVDSFKVFLQIPKSEKPASFATAVVDHKVLFFVTSYCADSSACGGVLRMYSAEGALRKTWSCPSLCSGVAVDTVRRLVYLSGTVNGVIYRTAIDGADSPIDHMRTIEGARRLGPMLADIPNHRILVADVLGGKVYTLDTVSLTVQVVGTDLGQPLALSVGHEPGQIYLADGASKRIVSLKLRAGGTGTIIATKRFGDPTAVEAAPKDHLWVADAESATLTLVRIGDVGGRPGNRNPCDVNGDGVVDQKDIQEVMNQALGLSPATAHLNGDGVVNLVDVQRVVNAAMGGACRVGQ